MQTSPQASQALIREEIASTAYNLWEAAGHPSAQDMDFWLQAERLLKQPAPTQATGSKASAPQKKVPSTSKATSTTRARSF